MQKRKQQNFLRTSFNGWIKLSDLTLSTSSFEIFLLVLGFSNTMLSDDEDDDFVVTPAGNGDVVNADVVPAVTASAATTADAKNFIFLGGRV